jgi:hypothetical protein
MENGGSEIVKGSNNPDGGGFVTQVIVSFVRKVVMGKL